MHMNSVSPLKGVVLSEKAAFLGASNVYSFYVEDSANKHQIADAIKAKYNVTPSKINIVRVATRRTKNARNRTIVQRGHKKALVTLPTGVTIDFV
jgi:ribosomal protein L23